MLAEKDLDGEVIDTYIDYKEEAIKSFVKILETQEEQKEGEEIPKTLQFSQLLENIGFNRLDNVLATFSMEYAETRGNLNKE